MMKSFRCRNVSRPLVTTPICKMSTILSDTFCTLPAPVREIICWLRALNRHPNFLMIYDLRQIRTPVRQLELATQTFLNTIGSPQRPHGWAESRPDNATVLLVGGHRPVEHSEAANTVSASVRWK